MGPAAPWAQPPGPAAAYPPAYPQVPVGFSAQGATPRIPTPGGGFSEAPAEGPTTPPQLPVAALTPELLAEALEPHGSPLPG